VRAASLTDTFLAAGGRRTTREGGESFRLAQKAIDLRSDVKNCCGCSKREAVAAGVSNRGVRADAHFNSGVFAPHDV
jgi:hypothetical protein